MNSTMTKKINNVNRLSLAVERALEAIETLQTDRKAAMNDLFQDIQEIADPIKKEAAQKMFRWARKGALTIEPFRADVDRLNAVFDLYL